MRKNIIMLFGMLLVLSLSGCGDKGAEMLESANETQLHSMWGYGNVTSGRIGVTFHVLSIVYLYGRKTYSLLPLLKLSWRFREKLGIISNV